jgi:hypothetical protein
VTRMGRRVATLRLYLYVENNNRHLRGKRRAIDSIVRSVLPVYPRIASAKVLPVGVVASAEMLPAIAPATIASPLLRRGYGHRDDTLGAGRTD